jgi:hypothetical protein
LADVEVNEGFRQRKPLIGFYLEGVGRFTDFWEDFSG